MKRFLKSVIISSLLVCAQSDAVVSVVYNLRISETSKRSVIDAPQQHFLASLTTFGSFREQYDGLKNTSVGEILSFTYANQPFFVRAYGAFGRVATSFQDMKFSRVQTDDVLFNAGYTWIRKERTRLTLSGLLGVPTHKDTSLGLAQFGTGHYGFGGQMDGSFVISEDRNLVAQAAMRWIYFLPRNVEITITENPLKLKYALGNLVDLYCALTKNIKRHGLEAGYDASFIFDGRTTPNLFPAARREIEAAYIRHTFYGLYSYRFLIHNVPNVIATAFSYGFEPTPKVFGFKNVYTAWASWGVLF